MLLTKTPTGAGIAGLALALALHNRSIPFTLYESAAEFSVVGAGIGFGPNGLRAMDGIEKRFRARYDEVCVGNRGSGKEGIFFEGMLMERGLGAGEDWYGGGDGRSAWGGKGYTRKSVCCGLFYSLHDFCYAFADGQE
jgi:salicylate hydroxylase